MSQEDRTTLVDPWFGEDEPPYGCLPEPWEEETLFRGYERLWDGGFEAVSYSTQDTYDPVQYIEKELSDRGYQFNVSQEKGKKRRGIEPTTHVVPENKKSDILFKRVLHAPEVCAIRDITAYLFSWYSREEAESSLEFWLEYATSLDDQTKNQIRMLLQDRINEKKLHSDSTGEHVRPRQLTEALEKNGNRPIPPLQTVQVEEIVKRVVEREVNKPIELDESSIFDI